MIKQIIYHSSMGKHDKTMKFKTLQIYIPKIKGKKSHE